MCAKYFAGYVAVWGHWALLDTLFHTRSVCSWFYFVLNINCWYSILFICALLHSWVVPVASCLTYTAKKCGILGLPVWLRIKLQHVQSSIQLYFHLSVFCIMKDHHIQVWATWLHICFSDQGIEISLINDNIYEWSARINGSIGTSWEGEYATAYA